MAYEISFHVKGKGTKDVRFDHRPTEDEMAFLIERDDIEFATLWRKSGSDWIRVYDII